MQTIQITESMKQRLEELRRTRERYEAVSGTKVIGARFEEMDPEEIDKIELVNAIKAARELYESMALGCEIMKEVRTQCGKSVFT